jgi:hypothetical protein
MANWNNPILTTQYDVFLAECKDRDVDSGTMFLNPPTNPPVGSVRFNRSTKIFEEWNGTAWIALVLGITGGGTGANSQGSIAASLGLGTMAYQNSNAVNISAGAIVGLTSLGIACTLLPSANATFDIGSNTARFRRGYFNNGLVIPVGVDAYVTG